MACWLPFGLTLLGIAGFAYLVFTAPLDVRNRYSDDT